MLPVIFVNIINVIIAEDCEYSEWNTWGMCNKTCEGGFSQRQRLVKVDNKLCPLPVNTKHLYNICTMLDQRRRRWADVVQMLFKCLEFVGLL